MSDETKPAPQHKQQNDFIARIGIFIVLSGLVAGFMLSGRVFSSKAFGLFARPLIDFGSIETFTGIDCPVVLGRNETGTIITTITNKSAEEKEYSISIAAQYNYKSIPIIHSGTIIKENWFLGGAARQVSGRLPAGETASIQWELFFPQGENISDATIIAYINNGNRSFWGSCGIAFTKIPWLKGNQVIALIWVTMPVGILLWLYGRRRFSKLSIIGIILSIILSLFILLTLIMGW
jgi:hypothetical protein